MSSVAIVESSVLWNGQEVLPGVSDALQRFALRNVPVLVLDLPQDASSSPSSSPTSYTLESALLNVLQASEVSGTSASHLLHYLSLPSLTAKDRQQILLRAQKQQWRLDQSWMVTSDQRCVPLAGQLGIQGIAWVDPQLKEGPPPPLGVILNVAQDLKDAPRVMIPPQGGCWHDHR